MVFKKNEDSPTFSKSANRKEPPSIISADLHIVGDIDSKGELHVEGRVDGNIRCESLTIGDTGQVEGKIVTTALSLLGSVTGTVRARTVKIMKTAHLIGDVAHEKIEIEAGAVVDGLYKHLKPEDFEKQGQRLLDVTSPEPTKPAISRTAKSNEAPAKLTEQPATANSV